MGRPSRRAKKVTPPPIPLIPVGRVPRGQARPTRVMTPEQRRFEILSRELQPAVDAVLEALGIKSLPWPRYAALIEALQRTWFDRLAPADQRFRRSTKNSKASPRAELATQVMKDKYHELRLEGKSPKQAWSALPGEAAEALEEDERQLRRWRKQFLADLPH